MNTKNNVLIGALGILTGIAMLMAPTAVMTTITGCSSTPGGTSITNIVTAPRVEAVVAVGTYYGARELCSQGKRADVEKIDGALRSLKASNKRDLVAIAVALREGGLTWLETPEGVLAFGVASSIFDDRYGPEVVLNNVYADAVLAGALRGIELALAQPNQARALDGESLKAQAAATRPRR